MATPDPGPSVPALAGEGPLGAGAATSTTDFGSAN